ncbi:hypothetical protein IDM40_04065 [Nocardiopsis sp. HNM0947]|uniref:Alkaline shock response membrane anchor protein AmaP n=1 Tax=Nocardiopsis coralli TaxID=2772213 RepID=A0ABR9P230_9ACTN|nr:hypothetical protein [Nocardiopsis coralli]MBE2997886.1 hypothetical protein [Nocardiopsis coralli]
MRTVSGRRNRTALILGGGSMLVAALWIASAATPLVDRWPEAAPHLPHGDSLLGEALAAQGDLLLPAAAAVAVVVTVAGFLLLAAQLPRAPQRNPLRITGGDDRVLGSVNPGVLERALVDAMKSVSGVTDASVRLGGGVGAPWIRATVTVAQEAEAGWVAESVRERLIDDVSVVLGTAPVRVDLLLRLRSVRAPHTAQLRGSDARTTEAATA